MIKAVLFDLGGTLHVSTSTPEREIWFAQRVISRLGEYGIALNDTPESLAKKLKVNSEIYKSAVEESKRELPTEIIWNDYYLKEYNLGRERLKPVSEELSFLYDYERVCNLRRPHISETLQALKSAGLRIGMISNIISKSIVPHFLLEYGVADYFECVVTSADAGWRKPAAEIFKAAQDIMKLDASELCYVGDTLSRDVRGARNAKWKLVIQINNPLTAHRDKNMGGLGFAADYKIDDLADVPGIIDRENAKDREELG